MQDRPTVLELLEAVREFLERDVAPHVQDPRLRYHLRIAVSVLRIVERELPGEAARLHAELVALEGLLRLPPAAPPTDPAELRQRVLDATRALCDRIRRGEADAGPWRDAVLTHVRAAVEGKLQMSNPAQLDALRAELGREGER